MALSFNKSKVTDYLLVWGLIAVSGFQYFVSDQRNIFILLFFSIFIFLKRNLSFSSKYYTLILFFFIVELVQYLLIPRYDIKLILGTQLRLILSALIVCIANKNFITYYINIIYFFSIISFIFFIPCNVVPGFYSFFVNSICPFFTPASVDINAFYEYTPNIAIFCFHEVAQEMRNPGPFWEPGAFAVFLNIAMIFNLLQEKKLLTKKNIIFSITILTTLSTAGYIAYFVLVFSFYTLNQSLFKRILYLIILLPFFITLYFSLDFLNNKIERTMSYAEDNTSSRFGSARADLRDLSSSPFIGWGRGVETRFAGKHISYFSSAEHRNNGITDFFATYGLFLGIYFFSCYYLAMKNLCYFYNFPVSFIVPLFVVILLLGFSQSIFQYPLFKAFAFLHILYNPNITQPINSNSG